MDEDDSPDERDRRCETRMEDWGEMSGDGGEGGLLLLLLLEERVRPAVVTDRQTAKAVVLGDGQGLRPMQNPAWLPTDDAAAG